MANTSSLHVHASDNTDTSGTGGVSCSAASGRDATLPTLTASINAFTRLWFGIQSATGLAIGDELVASDELIEALDRKIALPRPHLGWDF